MAGMTVLLATVIAVPLAEIAVFIEVGERLRIRSDHGYEHRGPGWGVN